MFDVSTEILEDGRVHKYALMRDSVPIPYGDALNYLQHDLAFRTFFISLLSDSPFAGFRWETPPITITTESRQFEFVLLNSPGFTGRTTDKRTYEGYFTNDDANDGVVVFASLGKDATLIVPSPRAPDPAYGHIAAFIRDAPDSQIHNLWRIVGATVQKKLSDCPLWLSTAGGGVAWLHIRLDSRPKYYGFAPYKMDRDSE